MTQCTRYRSLILYFIRDVLGSVRVDQGVPALLPVYVCRADVGDHHGVAVAVQGVLQQPGGGQTYQGT